MVIRHRGKIGFHLDYWKNKVIHIIPPDVVSKNRSKRLILPKSYQSSDQVIKQPNPMEDSNAQKNRAKSIEYISNTYIQRPRSKPLNKLMLKHELIANPKLRDQVINVDETTKAKEK